MATVSLCMIVKNEEDVLERCLKPMRKLVEEIIVVDTGSEDGTKEIAGRYADRVEDFVWTEDFSAARNAAFALASCEFCMWLDADDVLPEREQEAFLRLKEGLTLDTDVVNCNYAVAFDTEGRPSFFYPRERLVQNGKGFVWRGRVHEAIDAWGKTVNSDVTIEHRKERSKDPDRNLRIYERMAAEGERFDPRARLYYGRELAGHKRDQEALEQLLSVMEDESAWTEYRIEACLNGASCADRLGRGREGLKYLFGSFVFDLPRAELCCEAGRIYMGMEDYRRAAFWYEEALRAQEPEETARFNRRECRDLVPWLQLLVCWDKLGEHEKAYEYHLLVKEHYPNASQVKQNESYFRSIFSNSTKDGG